MEAGAAFNLLKGDWLPLTLGAKGQSDQGLDALDLSAEARLAYVLPFNLSLQSGEYRPAAAPLVNVIAAPGRGTSPPQVLGGTGGVWLLPARLPVLRSRTFDLKQTLLTRVQGASLPSLPRPGDELFPRVALENRGGHHLNSVRFEESLQQSGKLRGDLGAELESHQIAQCGNRALVPTLLVPLLGPPLDCLGQHRFLVLLVQFHVQ